MIKTRSGWYLVSPILETEQVTDGGIVVPESKVRSSPVGVGRVIEKDKHLGYIVYQKSAAVPATFDGENYLFVPTSAVVADIE